jgi:mannitol/fructose-specific phosphotransferase system IIA component (Ntr-type)
MRAHLDDIDYEAADRKPVHLVFLLLLGEGDWEKHLQVLSQLLLFLQSGAPASIKRAKNPREVHEIFLAELG